MLKPSQLACARAALCLPRPGGGLAADQAGRVPALEGYPLQRSTGIVGTPVSRHAGAKPGHGRMRGLATSGNRQPRLAYEAGAGLHAEPKPWRVARLPQPALPGYHEPRARIAWQAHPDPGLALAGGTLPHARHLGFGIAGLRRLAERHLSASATARI